MKTPTHTNLSQQIEQLVQGHLAAVRVEAEAAIARAFASATSGGDRQTTKRQPRSALSRRRSREELDAMAESLLDLVVANPGSAMTDLAPKLGLSARELQRPMGHLKRSGRIRSAGQRHLTRYFPMASEASGG